MKIMWTLYLVFVACHSSADATDRIYSLVSPATVDSAFGFSGTITTDGTFGDFLDVSFIKDWSIEVWTPSEIDGVSTELLTRASGPLFQLQYGIRPRLSVTESAISISIPESFFESFHLTLGERDIDPTTISWSGPFVVGPIFGNPPMYIPGAISVYDVGESPSVRTFASASFEALTIADWGMPLPEPGAVYLAISVSIGLALCIRRRSSFTNSKES